MALTIFATMVVLLCLGFPMMIPLIAAAGTGFHLVFGGFGQLETMIQQMMAGIRPAAPIAVPMFIVAADIMTRGQSAGQLITMVIAFFGHRRGGLRSPPPRPARCSARYLAPPRPPSWPSAHPCGPECSRPATRTASSSR